MTVTMMEPPAQKERRRPRSAPNGIPTTVPGAGDAWLFAAPDVAELLEPLLAAMNARLTLGGWTTNSDGDAGALEITADRAAARLGKTKEAVIRRLYDIRHGKARTCNAALADALLDAHDEDINHADIARLPAGMSAAREQVAVYIEDTEGRVGSPEEIEVLARRLMRFTIGYVSDTSPEAEDPAAFRAKLDEWLLAKRVGSGLQTAFRLYDDPRDRVAEDEQLALEAA